VTLTVEFSDKCGVIVRGKYNKSNNHVELPDEINDDSKVTAIEFDFNGKTKFVCLECGEGILNSDGKCTNCG